MSRTVTTNLGRFHQVRDGDEKRWLFECPTCGERLPVAEEHLNGSKPIDHCDRQGIGCSYGLQPMKLGEALIAKMQVRILMDEKPYDEPE